MQHGNFDVAVDLMRKAAALGLESILTPERYGGMELDLTSAMVVAEQFARDGSFGGWHGAHAGIGTLPLLLFGTEAQKQKYLPKLSSCEWIASFCLSEPQAGSDALAAKTRADLSPDGSHYILNGQKMWITNGGKADLFTVFAKIGGEQFSAFLVERTFPGVSTGAEEKKMGIKGSSTTPVFFDNVPVPVENLLGEAGRGHIIALEHPQYRASQARRIRHRRREERAADFARLRERTQSVRHDHLAFRHDPAQARRNGDAHLCRRIDDVSRGRPDPEPSRRLFVGRSRRRRIAS